MAIDTSFTRKRIEKTEHLYILFSRHTHLPFIECDEETFDDQVYVFTTEEMTQAFARSYAGRKIALEALRIPNKMYASFFRSLYMYGVTAILFQEEGVPVRVSLKELAEAPDIEKMKNERIPQADPEMQLTGIYFMQELRRPVERDADEKKELHDLEEEMAHNLFRARFIVAMEPADPKGAPAPGDTQIRVKVPLVRTKDGRSFQPVFTDLGEFRRFSARREKKKMHLMAVPYTELSRMLTKDAEGFLINPAGFGLPLTAAQLERLQKTYGDRA